MTDSTCYVELGSGKGLLTFHLAQAVQAYVKTPETSALLLVDRESHRHKRDNKLKSMPKIQVERMRVDLADFALGQIEAVKICDKTVGFSKHLCGEATDLALKCLLENNSLDHKVSGILIATCCHHKCAWNSYVGQKYFREWGFQEEDFLPLTNMSSWAVCGTGSAGFADGFECDLEAMKTGWKPNLNMALTMPEKRILGVFSKRILDYGRILYINEFGFRAHLSTYASLKDTLENMAMIATRNKPTIPEYPECESMPCT